jgi:hypothetical protein
MLQNAYGRKMIIGIVLEERLRAGSRAALRQTKSKSVWHSARNGSIAHILQGGEKAPWPFGGLFRRLKKAGEERGGRAGYHKSNQRHCARWRKKGEPAPAGYFQYY